MAAMAPAVIPSVARDHSVSGQAPRYGERGVAPAPGDSLDAPISDRR
jgi:hypothetical protein